MPRACQSQTPAGDQAHGWASNQLPALLLGGLIQKEKQNSCFSPRLRSSGEFVHDDTRNQTAYFHPEVDAASKLRQSVIPGPQISTEDVMTVTAKF